LNRALCVLLIVFGLVVGSPAGAQSYSFTASLLGGLSGSFDADPDPGFGNLGLQLGFSWVTERKAQVGVRLGRLDFGGEQTENLLDSDLTYINIAGEYRYTESYYESGVYLGLGYYSLSGTPLVAGGFDGDSGIGLVLGLTGDFTLSDRFTILVDVAGHFVDIEGASVFGSALVGVGYRF